ncbi:MAG: YicC family protein [Chlorobi bacterium]|nr:YicC family protein [Chlorobiota bacterium]
MIRSMTGYGKATAVVNGIPYQVELKSLNSKYFDLSVRLPHELRAAEMEIRKLLEDKLKRGKVTVQITPEGPGDMAARQLNTELLKNYTAAVREVFPQADESQIVASLLRNPDLWYQAESPDAEEVFRALLPALEQAAEELDAFRRREGQTIARDMEEKAALIRDRLEKVRELAPRRKEKLKEKLLTSLAEAGVEADPERFEQELIYYLDRWDINEEMQRLATHLDHFAETLHDPSRDLKGKKLNFIAQEMGREINTTGSKASDADIQRLVVEMKDALEKIKEQTANVL